MVGPIGGAAMTTTNSMATSIVEVISRILLMLQISSAMLKVSIQETKVQEAIETQENIIHQDLVMAIIALIIIGQDMAKMAEVTMG